MERVFVIQKEAVRYLAGKEKWVWVVDHFQPQSCVEIFKDLLLLTAPACYIFETIKFFLKFGKSALVGENTERVTRQSSDFHVNFTRLRKSEKEINHAGATFFNKLPRELKEKRNNKNFYKLLKEYLVGRILYSVGDF